MNLRFLSFLAVSLAVLAIVAWVWIARNEPRAVEIQSSQNGKATSTGESSMAPLTANSPIWESRSVPSPAEPAPMASSVVPGMPLVRSVATPSIVSGKVLSNAATYRPEPHAEEKSELQGVQTMLRDYRTRMGENPVGSNAEIMKAVMGDNPAKARLGPPQGQQVNDQGELVDRWGTPYFFHQLSKNSMEIRSAGPDQRMWTPDDLVTK